MCGKYFSAETNYFVALRHVTEAKCNGRICHLEVSTEDKDFHAGVDCVQIKETRGNCSCETYGDSERLARDKTTQTTRGW